MNKQKQMLTDKETIDELGAKAQIKKMKNKEEKKLEKKVKSIIVNTVKEAWLFKYPHDIYSIEGLKDGRYLIKYK